MERISRNLTNWLIFQKVIIEEEREVYEYGIFQMIMNALDTISILVLAFLLHEAAAACCYMAAFVMLRKYAGGFHAKSVLGCYTLTVTSSITMLLIIKFISIPETMLITLWAITGLIIFLFAPVQNRNKILDEVECIVYRKRAILVWTAESILMWLLYLTNFVKGAEGILASHILTNISMLAELIHLAGKKRKEENL
ncbi:MAG: accessory gene regulator B family protein [Lachnospiraceae bacterium]|nr:accessory gene regulator B family protein [Lachnospiraceae bacterium]